MRKVIFNMSDLSDSKEVMMKKTPFAISGFIFFVAVFTVVALVFASFGEIENYVVSAGEIRPEKECAKITSILWGNISQILVKNGETVKKGDVLLLIDNEGYLLDKEAIDSKIISQNALIENYKKLIDSIKKDSNVFDEKEDAVFYYYYKSYESEIKNVLQQLKETQNKQDMSLDELNASILSIKEKIDNINKEYNSYVQLYNSVKNEKKYKGNDQSISLLYDKYVLSVEKAKIVYSAAKLQYESLKKHLEENVSGVTSAMVEEADLSVRASKADLELIKLEFISQLDEVISSKKSEISSLEKQLDLYNSQKEHLETPQNTDLSLEQIKNSYCLNLNETLKSLYTELNTLKNQSESIDKTIENTSITALSDGVVTYYKEYIAGESISAGAEIGIIVPNTDKYVVEMYIPEYEIANVQVGEKTEFIFTSISSTQYEKINGEITYISADSFINQNDGRKYYKAKSCIPKSSLKGKNGDEKKLQIGMSVEVHTITEKITILNWLFEKLNFKG